VGSTGKTGINFGIPTPVRGGSRQQIAGQKPTDKINRKKRGNNRRGLKATITWGGTSANCRHTSQRKRGKQAREDSERGTSQEGTGLMRRENLKTKKKEGGREKGKGGGKKMRIQKRRSSIRKKTARGRKGH